MDNKQYQAVQTYLNDLISVKERADRTDVARRKRGENSYCSKLKVSSLEECYIINTTGEKRHWTVVIRYGKRYFFGYKIFCECGEVTINVNVLTEHFIEQYRGRYNMYSSPISKVLFDIAGNTAKSTKASTERFENALSLGNRCCVPVAIDTCCWRNRVVVITTFITCLNVQDKKVSNLHNAAFEMSEKIKNTFRENINL